MSLSYGITFWGYRKGSRANSNQEFIGITCIKCYLLRKIHLRHNSTVKAARVELMLLSEICCLSMSSCRWCYRYPKVSATPWGVSKSNNIWRVEFSEGWVWQERATYWMAVHWDSPRLHFKILICCKSNWAQDSRRILSDITDCSYDTTHLQENPQRLGWGSWRDLLYYILGLHPLVSGLAGSELN